MSSQPYVVILFPKPGQTLEYFETVDFDGRMQTGEGLAKRATDFHKLTTPRGAPQTIAYEIMRIGTTDGALVRHYYGRGSVTPALTQMTPEELMRDAEALFNDNKIPPELHESLMGTANEYGHSAGCEEVYSLLCRYVDMLAKPLQRYARRITRPVIQVSGESVAMPCHQFATLLEVLHPVDRKKPKLRVQLNGTGATHDVSVSAVVGVQLDPSFTLTFGADAPRRGDPHG